MFVDGGVSNGIKAWQRLAFGELTKDNLNSVQQLWGYFWADGNLADHEIKRTRQYPHKLMQFPESDPYHSLYALANSDNLTDFWLALEQCQQNRSRVRFSKAWLLQKKLISVSFHRRLAI